MPAASLVYQRQFLPVQKEVAVSGNSQEVLLLYQHHVFASTGVFNGVDYLKHPKKLLSDEGVTPSLLMASGVNTVSGLTAVFNRN